jgi:transcriptional regulator with XRE-family HTH domain
MGVKRSVIARLEAGERPLRFSEFMVLARVLKVSPEALLATFTAATPKSIPPSSRCGEIR